MNKKENLIKIVRVKKNDTHISALYELLKKREFNISNNDLPKFSEHKSFVINHPYRAWYLIEIDQIYVGTLYLLKNNCIGIYIENQNEYFIRKIIKWVLINKKPLPPIKSVRAAGFHINLSPTNKIFSAILEEIGAVPIQVTYSLKNI